MDYITELQNEYKFFSDMLKNLEKKKKKTPGNGFAKMKCKEKIAELEAIWAFGDAALGIMTFPNLISIILLTGVLKKATKEYFSKEHVPYKQ